MDFDLFIFIVTSIGIALFTIILLLVYKLYKVNREQLNFQRNVTKEARSIIMKFPKIQTSLHNTTTAAGSVTDEEELGYGYLSMGKSENKFTAKNYDIPKIWKSDDDDEQQQQQQQTISKQSETGSEIKLLPFDEKKRTSSVMSEHLTDVPIIIYTLLFKNDENKLFIYIERVNNLPLQFRKNCSSYVKVSLKTFRKTRKMSKKTKWIRNTLNPEYNQIIEFSGLKFDEIRNYRLHISTFAKSKTLSKQILVGDLYVALSRPDFEPDDELICCDRISLACPITGKHGPVIISGSLGFILIELQYQCDVHRLKVMIRKAHNLPLNKSTTLPVLHSPEFYVIVSLGCDGEVVNYKETQPAAGTNPVWNQPFLFYLEENREELYYLQILVMRGRLYSKDGTLGQVTIGPKGSISGQMHWQQTLNETQPEICKWHELISSSSACF